MVQNEIYLWLRALAARDFDAVLEGIDPLAAPSDPPAEPWTPDRVPTDFEMVAYAVNSLSRQPARLVSALRRTAETALAVRRRNREPDISPPPAPFQAPRTSINVPISPRRSFGFVQLPLEQVKAVKNALGGTVNDVVLALWAGALRRVR